MRRYLFLVLATFFIANVSSFAQDYSGGDDAEEQQGCGWYFGVDAGAQIFMGRNDCKMFFGDRIAPSLDLIVGKKLSNVFSVDLNLSNSRFRGVTSPLLKDAHFIQDKYIVGHNPDEALVQQDGYLMNIYLRCLADITEWLRGSGSERKSSLSAFLGGGLYQGFSKAGYAASPSINAGLVYGYRFNESLTLNATFDGALVSSNFDGENCSEHIFHGLAGINVGIIYSFGR